MTTNATTANTRAVDNEKVYAWIDDLIERRDNGTDIEAWLRATTRNGDDLLEMLTVAVEVIWTAQN